uniref:Uncharacterized protein n=1 Tax=Cannabis sativa TaxID=3483 RepID=A0A803PTP1_CANSA
MLHLKPLLCSVVTHARLEDPLAQSVVTQDKHAAFRVRIEVLFRSTVHPPSAKHKRITQRRRVCFLPTGKKEERQDIDPTVNKCPKEKLPEVRGPLVAASLPEPAAFQPSKTALVPFLSPFHSSSRVPIESKAKQKCTIPVHTPSLPYSVEMVCLLCQTRQACVDSKIGLVLLPDQITVDERLQESDGLFQVEDLVTMENLREVGLIAPHQDITHLSVKESVQESLKGDLEEVGEAIEVITAKEDLKAVKADEQWLEDWRRQFPNGLSKVEELSIRFKDVIPNEGAPRASTFGSGEMPFHIIRAPTVSDFKTVNQYRFDPYFLNLDPHSGGDDGKNQASRSRSLEPAPPVSNPEAAPKAPGMDATSTTIMDLTEPFLLVEPLNQVPLESSGGDSSYYNGPVVINQKHTDSSNGGANKKERVETKENVLQLAASRRQSAITSCRLNANRFAMMASRDLMYVADSVRTQANTIGLMAERNCSLIVQLAYDLEVLKVEHANAK